MSGDWGEKGSSAGSCPSAERFSELIDGELPAPEQVGLREHLERCADCRRTLAELDAVVTAARTLPERAAPPHIWTAVAARIRAESPIARRPPRRIALSSIQAIAAGFALVFVSAASTWLLVRDSGALPAVTATVSEAGERASGADPVVRLALAGLDARTAAVFEANLAALDAALADVRAALEAAPTDEFLLSQIDALGVRRAELIRRTTRLGGGRL